MFSIFPNQESFGNYVHTRRDVPFRIRPRRAACTVSSELGGSLIGLCNENVCLANLMSPWIDLSVPKQMFNIYSRTGSQ